MVKLSPVTSIHRGADTILITNPTNIRYLTGFVGVDSRDAYCVQTSQKIYFFTNSLYMEQAKKLSPILIARDHPISSELKKLCEKLNIKRLAFEETDLTVSEYNKLKKELKGVTLVPNMNRIEEMRIHKTDSEIKNIKAAAKITDDCFDFILGKLKPGVTESDIAWEIESFFRIKGAQSAFSPIVAFNANSSQPHYCPTDKHKLTANSLILLDIGARVNGYCADMTRVVFLGKPKSEWLKAYETVAAAQQHALDLIAHGERNGKILDEQTQKAIKKAGLSPYTHSLGHAVGLDIHEAPRLTMKKSVVLAPNMVITVEPGVYVEGQYGIRIEDLVLLREERIEILSKSTKNLTIL